jgi:hypothetical protein
MKSHKQSISNIVRCLAYAFATRASARSFTGKLTKNASEKIDELFGNKYKETFLDKVRNFFLKIDKKIFKSSSRMFNTTFYKRKK